MIEMPWNSDMERAVLGSILIDNAYFYEATSDLVVDDFYSSNHRYIFRAITELVEDGKRADILSVHHLLQSADNGSKAISAADISSMTTGVVGAAVTSYTSKVRELAQRRRLIALCNTVAERARAESLDVLVDEVQNQTLDIMADADHRSTRRLREIVPEVFANLDKLASWGLGEKVIGLPTGISKLDKFMGGGYRRKEYYVWGGYAGDGKTSIAMATILEAVNLGWPVLYFSHEMDRGSVVHRLLAANSTVSFAHLRDPRELQMFEYEELKQVRQIISEWPVWVEDSGSMEISKLRAVARLHIRRHGVAVIIVDYIQKVRANGYGKRHEMISAVSEGLRELAKGENVIVIALSQLTQPEDKKKRAPRLFEYKESGDIVNDAHAVMAVYRPVNENGTFTGEDKLIILKQRSGQVNTKVDVKYNADRLIYEPY